MRYLNVFCAGIFAAVVCQAVKADDVDTSKPDAVILAYGKAFHDSDVAGAKALAQGTDEQYQGQERFITLAHSRENLYQQAIATYGEAGKKVIDYKGDLGDWLMHQDNWRIVAVGGDGLKAMVVGAHVGQGIASTAPRGPKIISGADVDAAKANRVAPVQAPREPIGSHVQLVKVDGKWKVDLTRLEYVSESTLPYAPLVKVFDDVAAGIKAGKYASADDAKKDMQNLSTVAVKTRSGKHTSR